MTGRKRCSSNTFIGQANVLHGKVDRLEAEATTIALTNGKARSAAPPEFYHGLHGHDYLPSGGRSPVCDAERIGAAGEADRVALLGPTLVHDLLLEDGTNSSASEVRGPSTFIPEPGAQLFAEIDTMRCHAFPSEPGSIP